jgi:hypothetical protein
MGEVIRQTAATENIVEDLHTANTRAIARGGKLKELAEEHLASIVKLTVTIEVQLHEAKEIANPILAALDAEEENANLVIGKVSDDIWNAVGRPGADPSLAIMFPGGKSFYVDGDLTEQPDRMDLLVHLLEAGVHPKLPADKAAAFTNEVRGAAVALRATVDAARAPRTRVKLLERVKKAIARSAAIELASFKRALKAHGFSEPDIHSVIPNRSRPTPKKPGAAAPSLMPLTHE